MPKAPVPRPRTRSTAAPRAAYSALPIATGARLRRCCRLCSPVSAAGQGRPVAARSAYVRRAVPARVFLVVSLSVSAPGGRRRFPPLCAASRRPLRAGSAHCRAPAPQRPRSGGLGHRAVGPPRLPRASRVPHPALGDPGPRWLRGRTRGRCVLTPRAASAPMRHSGADPSRRRQGELSPVDRSRFARPVASTRPRVPAGVRGQRLICSHGGGCEAPGFAPRAAPGSPAPLGPACALCTFRCSRPYFTVLPIPARTARWSLLRSGCRADLCGRFRHAVDASSSTSCAHDTVPARATAGPAPTALPGPAARARAACSRSDCQGVEGCSRRGFFPIRLAVWLRRSHVFRHCAPSCARGTFRATWLPPPGAGPLLPSSAAGGPPPL